jgi:hypothetical protein
MATHSIVETIQTAGTRIEQSHSHEADGEDSRVITVPGASVDLLINLAIDYSELESFYMLSDRDMTIETNSGSAPGDTIALKAGKPLVWYSGSYFACPFTVDVTKLYATLASGVDATLKVEVLQDATP